MQSPLNPQDPQQSRPAAKRIPEMVAATSEPFFLGPQPKEIILSIHAPTGPALLHMGSAHREVTLSIENVTCSKPAPPFRVYLNVPPNDSPEQHPELQVGNLGTFGLVQRSDPTREHGGDGMTFTLSITEPVTHLAAARNWDDRTLRVSFSPGFWEGQVPQVKVGRVSLYYK